MGTAYGTGWQFSIAAATSVNFDAGTWYWQAVATKTGSTITLGSGQSTVLAALSYSGTPAALDGRSQAQKDLDAVRMHLDTAGNLGICATPVAGNGLMQLANGTTRANGIAAGTDCFMFRDSSAQMTHDCNINLASTRVLKVNGTQVIGARDTGWTAMTGSSNKATAYDTSTITLAQLAGRVMELQAALTTHGVIGA